MRLVIVMLMLAAAAWWLRSCEDPEPRPVEETFIGDQVEALREAERFEDDYIDMARTRQEEIDRQAEEDGG